MNRQGQDLDVRFPLLDYPGGFNAVHFWHSHVHEDYIRAGADVVSTNTFQLSERAFLHHFKDADHMKRVGARGLPDNCTSCREICWVVANHSKRTFVPKVDFISGPGWVPERIGGDIKYGHPLYVFSNLGVMDFDPKTHRMRLASVHTGVTAQQVQENTGFELVIPDKVPETEPPTEEEVRLIRGEIDPLGVRRLDHARGPDAAKIMAEIREKEKALPV